MASIHDRELRHSPERVLAAVEEATELWGGIWNPAGRGGHLTLPVVRGLRRGVLVGRISTAPTNTGSTLHLEIESSHYRLNQSAVAILVLGGLGGITTVLWPFFPVLLRLAPVGAILAVVAWLLVSSRLRSSSEQDFLDLVSELADRS